MSGRNGDEQADLMRGPWEIVERDSNGVPGCLEVWTSHPVGKGKEWVATIPGALSFHRKLSTAKARAIVAIPKMLAMLESIRDDVYLPGSTLDEVNALIAEVKGGTP